MDISTATTLASGLVGLIVPAVVQAFKKYISGEYGGLVSLAASILLGTLAIADKKKWQEEAFAYNSPVTAWGEIQSRATQLAAQQLVQNSLFD